MSIATLILNADLYAPEHVGHRDILVAGGKIIALAERLEPNIPGMESIDAAGRAVTPGLIDQHIHVTGGGGEAGPVSRCPEASLHEFIEAGITTVVGVSGPQQRQPPGESPGTENRRSHNLHVDLKLRVSRDDHHRHRAP